MSKNHFRGRIAQKALIIKGGKVLITRDSRDTVFELPGGRLDAGEEPVAGILREIREELGVTARVDNILAIKKVFHARDAEAMIAVYYEISLIDDNAEFVVDPVEVAETKWVDAVSYVEYDYFPEYKQALEQYFESSI